MPDSTTAPTVHTDAERRLLLAFGRCNPSLHKAWQFLAKWGEERRKAQEGYRVQAMSALIRGERDEQGNPLHPMDILRRAESTEAPIIDSFKAETRDAISEARSGVEDGIAAVREQGARRLDINFAPGTQRASVEILAAFRTVRITCDHALAATDDTRRSLEEFVPTIRELLGKGTTTDPAKVGLFTWASRLSTLAELPADPAHKAPTERPNPLTRARRAEGKPGPEPEWKAIAHIVEQHIRSVSPGKRLPSMRRIAQEIGRPYSTVRKAINETPKLAARFKADRASKREACAHR